ncbi:helix-turn-helix transcriptional regulator [Pedobacter gandavensis]|uniref:helix-turn-helix transcriptional regulator n=1 Tax=Pedobacter gandavensis TaxID=2679963 RepID=UPI00292E2FA4|nr:helix-turn-helix transcriptional regulator [Pedobacter gandavensis]
MRAHIKLLFNPSSISHPPFDQRKDLSLFALAEADSSYMTLNDVRVLTQSISHHLAHIQLYEYHVKSYLSVDFEVTQDSLFLTAMQNDCSAFCDDADDVISELLGNSCRLSYIKGGKYKRILMAGHHKILVLTINPEWLISKYGNLEDLQELIHSYQASEIPTYALPSFNIARQQFTDLLKLNNISGRRDTEIDLLIFLNTCIKRYLQKLQQGRATLKNQEKKTQEIAEFLNIHFAGKIAGDETALADHFMISGTMLARLAKQAFGKPLHQQVIDLRMHHGLKLLLSTQNTIQEISVRVGYDDPKYFSRAFKKKFGLPPNEVRICV